MNKYIRWQGLVGFIITIALFVVLTFLIAPSVIKVSIEKGLTFYLGGEVNVEDVDLNWQPLQLTINQLQATDNKSPSHNVVQFEQAKLSLDLWQYLFGKVLIDDLTVTGIQFNTLRKSVGSIYRQPEQSILGKAGEDLSSSVPSFEQQLPDIKALLTDSNLLTVKAAEQLEQRYQTELGTLQALQHQLPSKEDLEQYQQQVDSLSKSKVKSIADATKLQKNLDALKTKFKKDQTLVAKSKQQLEQSKKRLLQAATQLREAPTKDWQNIERTYQLDKIDNADFAHMLFGEDARQYYQVIEQLYLRAQPLIAKQNDSQQRASKESYSSGRFIYFSDETPLPPWLVKQAKFELLMPQGRLLISASELTAQHWHRNKASQINVTSNNLYTTGSGQLKATFISSKPTPLLESNTTKEFIFNGNWQLLDVPVIDASLRENDSFSLAIASALINANGQFKLVNNAIHSSNDFSISKAQYRGNANSALGDSLISALHGVDDFALHVNIDGALQSPDYQIDSDLNSIVSDAISTQLHTKLQGLKDDFSMGLDTKVSSAINQHNDQNVDFLSVESVFVDTDNALNALLESKIGADKKQQIEDKLKKKLGKLFG